MNFVDDIKPITFLKTHAASLIAQIKNNHRPVLVTQNGEPQVVVQSIEEYQKQQNLIYLLKLLALGERDIKIGNLIDQADVFADIEKQFDF